MYPSKGGAYLFLPQNHSRSIVNATAGHAFISRGPLVQELVTRLEFILPEQEEGETVEEG